MPLITHEQMIKQYWETVKNKYPDMTYDQFEVVCKSPFKAIKEWIKGDNFPQIRIKYMGKFTVVRSTVLDLLKRNQEWYDKGVRTEALYLHRKKYLENYLRDLENEVDDFEVSD